jgi:hypothetical protein
MTISPDDYSHWMRLRFPELNKQIDDGAADDTVHALAEESVRAAAAIMFKCDDRRERFTYVSMVHAALYRHNRAKPNALLEDAIETIEQIMILLAQSLGVESRFLAFFYLLHNPEIDGLHAQFRPGKGEDDFARINRQGTKNFQHAALNLLEAYRSVVRGDLIAPKKLLKETVKDFREIVEWNRELAQSLDRDEFKAMTEYFNEVEVRGKRYRGVNAGDQPWSYIIDLLLGVDLKNAFEVGFDRKYPPEIKTSARAMAYEFEHHDYLHSGYLLPEHYAKMEETEQTLMSGPQSLPEAVAQSAPNDLELQLLLHEAMQTYLMTSNTHFGLARKFVPVDPNTQTQIGSSGTNIQKFLKEGLIDGRAKVVRDFETRHPEVIPALNIVGIN